MSGSRCRAARACSKLASFCRETRFVQEGRVNRRRERPIHHGATAWRCQEISGGGRRRHRRTRVSRAVESGEQRRPPWARGPGATDGGLGGSRGPGAAWAQECCRDLQQVVRQDRRADEDLEPLPPLEQAATQAPTAEEDRDAAFDAGAEALAPLEARRLSCAVRSGVLWPPRWGRHSVPTPAVVTAATVAGEENPRSAA